MYRPYMADTTLDGFRFMRELALDVHPPEHAHALVITGGRESAHLALTLVDACMSRTEARIQAGTLTEELLAGDLRIITAAIQAWRTVYAIRGV
jgi:hypothetical protein